MMMSTLRVRLLAAVAGFLTMASFAGAYADSTSAPPVLSAATAGQSLGVGQTWHAVSRAKGVWYTNTYGRPIQVMVSIGLQSGGNNCYFYINGLLMGHHGNGSSTDHSVTYSYVIPAGATYMFTGTGWRTAIGSWAELY